MKIYGKRKEIADGYYEVEYKEYRPDGTLKAIGTEDFSALRLRTATEIRCIYTWDGSRYNKGGHRWFDRNDIVRVTKNSVKELKAYAKVKYPDAEIIDVRKA